MKDKAAIAYLLKKQFTFLAIFFIWWIVMGVILPSIGLLVEGSTVSTDVLMPMMGFAVIIAFMSTNSDFNLFIQIGMRRLHIFLVNMITSILMSASIAIVVYLFSKITLNRLHLTAFLISKHVYYSEHIFVNILLLFIVMFFLSSIGLLLGTFNDMFKGIKKIIIILLVMSIPAIVSLVIQLSGDKVQGQSLHLLGRLIGFSSNTGFVIAPLMGTILICTGVCLVLMYFLNQHHEVSRKGE